MIMIRPLMIESPPKRVAMTRPRRVREKYSGGPNFRANSARGGATKVRPEDPDGPGDKRADGGYAQRGTGAPFPGHLVPVDAGYHRCRLSGDIDQDGSG